MSTPWSAKSLKATPVSADEILLLDSADANPSTQNKRASLGSIPLGITSINADTVAAQILAAGTGLNIVDAGDTHTYSIDSSVVTLTGSQALSNKTIDAEINSIINLDLTDLADVNTVGEITGSILYKSVTDWVVLNPGINGEILTLASGIPSWLAVPATGITSLNGDTTAAQIVAAGTGLGLVDVGDTHTLSIDSTVVTLTGTQSLTNKTIDGDLNTLVDINETQMNVSSGASGTVLTSTGVGSPPTYQSPAISDTPWLVNHDAAEFNLINLGLLNQKFDDNTAIHELEANHTVPATNDEIGFIDFYDDNSVATRTLYARIESTIEDPTDTSEDCAITIRVKEAGTLTSYIELNKTSTGLILFNKVLDMGTTNKIVNLADPTLAQDSATKAYVDSFVQGSIKWKEPVRVATTANVALTGEQTIDGILTSTDRILVKDQTAGAENGIYVTAAGAWTRAIDFDEADEILNGAMWVSEGTINADQAFVCTTDLPIVVDTTVLTFVQFSGLGQITAGTNLSKTANTLDFDPTGDVDMLGNDLINAGGITINNPADTFQYIITPAALAADRILNLPLMTGTDTLVLNDFAATLTNKTITAAANTLTIASTDLTDTAVIVRTDQTNTFGDFAQIFPDNQLFIQNPAATFEYQVIAAAIAADRTVTLPLLTGNDTFVTEAFAQTLTNKTIDGDLNTIIDINETQMDVSVGASGTVLTSNGVGVPPTYQAAGVGDMILANAQTNTGIKTFLDTTMKLRNVANTFDGFFVNTNTADRIYTLQDSSDVLVGRATTDTLTNKTVNLTSNTLSGTTAEFNTALSDNDFATLAGTETLTNKTLGTGTVFSVIPTINDGIKFTFNPDATDAGLNAGAQADPDPTAPVNGDIYYNSTNNKFRAYENSVWVDLIGSGSPQTPWVSDIEAATFDLNNLGNLNFSLTGPTGLPAATEPYISFEDALTPDAILINVPTGAEGQLTINAVEEYNWSATEFNFHNNILQAAGNIFQSNLSAVGITQLGRSDEVTGQDASDIRFNAGNTRYAEILVNMVSAVAGSEIGSMQFLIKNDNVTTMDPLLTLTGGATATSARISFGAPLSGNFDMDSGLILNAGEIRSDGTIAAAGFLKMENAAILGWRNAGGTSDHSLTFNASDQFVIQITSGSDYIFDETTFDMVGNAIESLGHIQDINANEVLDFSPTVASAVNHITISNAATGNPALILAEGDDANIGLEFRAKAEGSITFADNDGNEELLNLVQVSGAATNFVEITNSLTGVGPTIAPQGQTDIDLNIQSKGTGDVNIGNATTQGLSFYGQTARDQGAALTASDTTITFTAPGTPDFAIQDLTTTSPFGFVTSDEAQTVLQVIANLQARVNELEARLDTTSGVGLIAG